MYKNELNIINNYDVLYNNLMLKGKKINNRINSHKREEIISQMMIDTFNLKLNKDKRFEQGRYLYFYEISYYEIIANNITKICEEKIIKKASAQSEVFKINGIEYKIKLEKLNASVSRTILPEEKNNYISNTNELTLHSDKTSSFNNLSTSSTQSVNDEICYCRIFQDNYNKKNYLLKIIYTNHELDGNLITNEDIDIRNNLADILYYPTINDSSIIKKDKNILIEVKQNSTLEMLFNQMEKVLNNFKILLPNEEYNYFAFLNDENAKNNVNENEFIKKVKNYENQNNNFKIFIFLIKNNKILDLDLSDNVEYSVHFRNDIKKEINEIKTDIVNVKTELANIKTDISDLKKTIETKFESLTDLIKGLYDDKSNKNNDTQPK